MRPPSHVTDLTQQLQTYGFKPIYFQEDTIPCDFSQEVLLGGKSTLLTVACDLAPITAGWRLIETINPPSHFQQWVAMGKRLAPPPPRCSDGFTFKVDNYVGDPFHELLAALPNNRLSGDSEFYVGPAARMRRSAEEIEQTIPYFAERMGISHKAVSLPYGREMLQALSTGKPLEFWPTYYFGEWLADIDTASDKHLACHVTPFEDRKQLLFLNEPYHHWDKFSKEYNAALGFRLVVDPEKA